MKKIFSIIKDWQLIFWLIGAVLAANAYLAKASDLKLVEQRLEQKIQSDRRNDVQGMIWKFMDRYQCKDETSCILKISNEYEKEMFQNLILEYRELEKHINK